MYEANSIAYYMLNRGERKIRISSDHAGKRYVAVILDQDQGLLLAKFDLSNFNEAKSNPIFTS